VHINTFINITTLQCLLLVLSLFFIIRENQVKESQFVNISRGSNHSEPVSNAVLLQESLEQVLNILSGEFGVRQNGDFVTGSADSDLFSQVTGSSLNLDVFDKEFLEVGHIDNVVLTVQRAVHDELVRVVPPEKTQYTHLLGGLSLLLGGFLS
jgi:hypothetical protein